MSGPDVLVVGGGVVGCAVARWLAADHDLRLLERDRLAGGATGHASGLVSIAADYAETPGLARFALDWFADAEADLGYDERPNVGLVTASEVAAARERAERLSATGLGAAYHDAAGLEDRFPGVFDLEGFAGGVVYPGGWLDPSRLCAAHADAARAAGATIETGRAVAGLLYEDGDVVGVETRDGAVMADAVVVAAGHRSRGLVGEVADLPVRPFRYQTVNLGVERSLGPGFPIGWEHETRLYWRPEPNGELHVGGGTYFTDGETVRSTVTASFRDLVADTVPRRLRDLGEARVVGEACCPTGDAATPDGYPIVDRLRAGLVVATGLTGYGIMASPVVGRAVRALVTGQPAPFDLTPLGLARFDDRGTDFTLPYVVEDPAELAP